MNEQSIRELLVKELSSTKDGKDAAYISEMFIDKFSRRADLVMANGKLSVFEIKSNKDSLNRLEGQIETYIKFFEQVTIVCAEKHLSNVLAFVPRVVNVWKIDDFGNFTKIRSSTKINTLPKRQWLSFLPVDELKIFLRQEKIKSTGTRIQLLELAEKTPLSSIRSYVLTYLKRREQKLKNVTSIQNTVKNNNILFLEQSNYQNRSLENLTAIPRLRLPTIHNHHPAHRYCSSAFEPKKNQVVSQDVC